MFSTELDKFAHYDGMQTDPKEADWIYFGAPYDGTSSYRAGSRFAPEAIRQETLLCQEQYSPYFDRNIDELSIADVGNLVFPYGNTQEVLKRISSLTDEIVQANKYPVMIGGEHLVSLPVVQSLLNVYPDLRIIHLDAHADMADTLFEEKYSHGTVMRRIWERIGDQRIYQFGIRSGSQEEFRFAKEHNHLHPFNLDGIETHLESLAGCPIYLTIDLDCFDPSQIPGTGTPETGGVFFMEFISFLKKISHLNFVGIDINELAPRIDASGMSTVFAGKVVRETLCACLK